MDEVGTIPKIESAEMIIDNCQDTIFGGFAPNSESAVVLSKSLGDKTVMSGSVSKGKGDTNSSLQMISRPLMFPDELKSLPKGTFIVSKTGTHPMKTQLSLFFKWGIQFEESYIVEEKAARKVMYADKQKIEEEIIRRYQNCVGEVGDEKPDEDNNSISEEKLITIYEGSEHKRLGLMGEKLMRKKLDYELK